MKETKKSEKKSTSPLVFVGIGCLVLVVLMSAGTFFVAKFVAKKVIENKTGLNVQDLKDGKMTITDEKTGASMDIGNGKMPENFPGDLPIYPGAKVSSSLSSGQKEEGVGFWLTLVTSDSLDAVSTFYKTAFEKNGWTETANYSSGENQTTAIEKDMISGTVSLVREKDAQETQIVIVLSEEVK